MITRTVQIDFLSMDMYLLPNSYYKLKCKKKTTKKQKKQKKQTNLKAATKQQRKRKTIWFNPSYSMNVSTKVGPYFLNLIKKHFPLHRKFSKIFNRRNMKVSYSGISNMKLRMNINNKAVTNPQL